MNLVAFAFIETCRSFRITISNARKKNILQKQVLVCCIIRGCSGMPRLGRQFMSMRTYG